MASLAPRLGLARLSLGTAQACGWRATHHTSPPYERSGPPLGTGRAVSELSLPTASAHPRPVSARPLSAVVHPVVLSWASLSLSSAGSIHRSIHPSVNQALLAHGALAAHSTIKLTRQIFGPFANTPGYAWASGHISSTATVLVADRLQYRVAPHGSASLLSVSCWRWVLFCFLRYPPPRPARRLFPSTPGRPSPCSDRPGHV
ncbi:hypothetical protein BGZ61DRAFT_514145 [Ilyonectria robusta]|uniref:uncharacterized protein n=1 Tax=Ilyonectria robusta TaxID=1079257 RepID=UPI001E8CE014|nr:uncharacterized protein BGZ61DRAFT_514145 [Ilyonectria robusta]KAH8734747.1 hypothetical protein BGZ61DRAFT_514145 [Ilyonectria robusta]